MKRLLAIVMALIVILGVMPTSAIAKSNQMNDDVPVWDEETVRQYALDYVEGKSMDRLWGYYDLQIRRYMPMEAYETLLIEREWETGAFLELGTYTSFVEEENESKVHVLHLCMEKQDVDMYFKHKNKENDWEVMSVLFVPADEQPVSDGRDMLVDDDGSNVVKAEITYTEMDITVGDAPTALAGILTMPNDVGSTENVPGCILVHDFGPQDMNSTMGQTTMFADLAHALAKMGVASIRYDKRTYTYGESADMTVKEEVVDDAITAGELLKKQPGVNADCIVLIGHGLGGLLSPRIAQEADGLFAGMLMIGTKPESVLEMEMSQYILANPSLDAEAIKELNQSVTALQRMTEEDAREQTILGKNGYYYWEAQQYDQVKIMKKINIPTYIVQGRNDPYVPEKEGRVEYYNQVSNRLTSIKLQAFRGMNHLLMNDLSTEDGCIPTYEIAASLDTQVGRKLALWVLGLASTDE